MNKPISLLLGDPGLEIQRSDGVSTVEPAACSDALGNPQILEARPLSEFLFSSTDERNASISCPNPLLP